MTKQKQILNDKKYWLEKRRDIIELMDKEVRNKKGSNKEKLKLYGEISLNLKNIINNL